MGLRGCGRDGWFVELTFIIFDVGGRVESSGMEWNGQSIEFGRCGGGGRRRIVGG